MPVVRPDTVEMSAWGVAALAGIQVHQYAPGADADADADVHNPGRGVERARGGGESSTKGQRISERGRTRPNCGGPVQKVQS